MKRYWRGLLIYLFIWIGSSLSFKLSQRGLDDWSFMISVSCSAIGISLINAK